MNCWLGKSVLTLMCLLLVQNTALAYKETTHEEFSKYAVDGSVLNDDPSLLSDYGLSPYGAIEYKNSKNENASVQTLDKHGRPPSSAGEAIAV
ncbi:hypothetical protein MNBD_GAMMA15-811 [hydrothermal vent metagenome]|uniref:Uncharacterized protein n=1 Tax=hydrothermal vent metagenome TaxID=652676 RepID=A0A3B0YI30_9ZZZZ